MKAIGWYVDRSIMTVQLPEFVVGKNVIEITIPFGKSTFTEWCYLLGDFGVKVEGIRKTLTAPLRTIAFGDMVPQGVPFYTGNMTYRCEAVFGGDVLIRVPKYRGALVTVQLDDRPEQFVTFSPYVCEEKGVPEEKHQVRIKLYNTRQNGFGQLHHSQSMYYPQHPNSWRSQKDDWVYEYQFRTSGVLTSPEIYQKIEVK